MSTHKVHKKTKLLSTVNTFLCILKSQMLTHDKWFQYTQVFYFETQFLRVMQNLYIFVIASGQIMLSNAPDLSFLGRHHVIKWSIKDSTFQLYWCNLLTFKIVGKWREYQKIWTYRRTRHKSLDVRKWIWSTKTA